MDFTQLKKSNKDDVRKKLQDRIAGLKSKANYADDRFWALKRDKADNGSAVIRFLMAPVGEDFPFVRYWTHQFKGAAGWLFENCLTSLSGKACPICEFNSALWATELKANQDIVRGRKRKLIYVSNILVVNDPKEPENNGKVFLFKFGQKIFEKINDLLNPDKDGTDEPINPFSFWDGANFKLRAGKVLGYVNYDKSGFDNPSALCQGKDSDIKVIWDKEYPLNEFNNEKNFKSYAELKARFLKVVGNVNSPNDETAESKSNEDEVEVEVKPKKVKASKKLEKAPEPESESDIAPWATDDKDDLSYFENLAKA